ncbi:CYTH domain-containing protein [Bacillus sp. FJAT-50079]|uniref:CYTH domain-containing protein n=1 Tax=Bacillus sp. FJAT-50079 TaxID=2833577 RepID=UPI001BC9C7BB|nr:CYTH domain-containing protein [Bacillus sp. FJAT-50079]MBS4207953.1 CYTH domain-containing protein [Bacillus sp. FJAT-50079]
MTRQIEIEFKNSVSKDDFQRCLHYFHIKDTDFFTQINHYFDTENFSLKQQAVALRIREVEDRYELTLKKPRTIGLLEINQSLQIEEMNAMKKRLHFPLGEIKDELEQMRIDINQLRHFGSLTTKRAEISYEDGLLVFDHSYYLGHEDFEIEYEVIDADEGQKDFNDLLVKLNIPIQKAENKVKRFYQMKMKQNQKDGLQ